MAIIKRYRFFLMTCMGFFLLWSINHELGMKALQVTGYSLREMILIIPPIFILLGLRGKNKRLRFVPPECEIRIF